MFGRLFLMILVFAASVACADKKYAPKGELPGGPDRKTLTCMATFASGACVSMKWEVEPTESEFGTFVFQVFSKETTELLDSDGTMAVVLWMPDMGHGSSPVTVEKIEVGTYRASKVFFSMNGQWEIQFKIKNGKDVKDQAILPITR